jgi:hypothetical protein
VFSDWFRGTKDSSSFLNKFYNVRFEFLAAVVMKNTMFWDVTPGVTLKKILLFKFANGLHDYEQQYS